MARAVPSSAGDLGVTEMGAVAGRRILLR
jgi:hypothetical protein